MLRLQKFVVNLLSAIFDYRGTSQVIFYAHKVCAKNAHMFALLSQAVRDCKNSIQIDFFLVDNAGDSEWRHFGKNV